MSDQHSLSEQVDPLVLIAQKMQMEITAIYPLCAQFTSTFNSCFSSSITWETAFFLKLLVDNSDLNSRIISFWKNCNIFSAIGTLWDINLSTRAYNHIVSEANIYDYMYYIIDLLKGRFLKVEDFEYCIIIKPWYSEKDKLLSIIVVENYPEICLKILVGTKEDDNLTQWVDITIQEICNNSRVIERLSNLDCEELLVSYEDGFAPGEIKEIKSKKKFDENIFPSVSEKENPEIKDKKRDRDEYHKDEKEELYGEINNSSIKKVEEIQNENEIFTYQNTSAKVLKNTDDSKVLKDKEDRGDKVKKKQKNKLGSNFERFDDRVENKNVDSGKIFIDEKKVEKTNRTVKDKDPQNIPNLVKESHEIDKGCLIGDPFFKNEQETRQYIDPDQPYQASEDFNASKLPPTLLNLKNYILKNRAKYLSVNKLKQNDLQEWTSLVFHFLIGQENSLIPIDIFSSINLNWKIKIETEVLDVLRGVKEIEFLQYFSKIIKFAEGFAFEDFAYFELINKKANEDFLVTPIWLEGTNLKPILSILCIGQCELTRKYEYQLKILKFFNSSTNLESQIERIRKSGKYLKIEDLYGKTGINSLVLIEKNEKIVPVFPLENLKVKSQIKKIFLLIYLPRDSKDFTARILIQDGYSIEGKMIFIENKDYKDCVNLIEIQTNILVNSHYTLSITYNSKQGGGKLLDKSKRIIENLEYQFLFDTNFIKEGNYLSWSKDQSNNVSDEYYQLYIFVKYITQFKVPESLDSLISYFFKYLAKIKILKNPSAQLQEKIVQYINSNLIESISDDDIDGLYLPLCILALIEMFPTKPDFIEFSNLGKVLHMIEKHSETYLRCFRPKLNFSLSVKGLAKILALARIFDMNLKNYFDTIIDYKILELVLYNYLEILKTNQDYLTTEELEYILNYTNYFNEEQLKSISVKILGSIREIEQITEILLHPVLAHIPNEEKRKHFFAALNKYSPSNKELLKFLQFLEPKDFNTIWIFDISEIVEFVRKHLLDRKNVSLDDLPVIKQILEVILSVDNLQNFDLKAFCKRRLMKYEFYEGYTIFQLTPDYVPEIFTTWLEENHISPVSPNWGLAVVNQLNYLPIYIQKQIYHNIFSQMSENNLARLIDSVYKLESQVLKKAYKTAFTERLLITRNKKKLEEVLKLITHKRKSRGAHENHILSELSFAAQGLFEISEEDLTTKILKEPQENDILLELFKNYDKSEENEVFSVLIGFINGITRQIIDREILMGKFKFIVNHSKSERETFLEYIRYVLDNSVNFDNFYNSFQELEESVKFKLKDLKNIKRVILRFGSYLPQLFDYLTAYEQYSIRFDNLRISEFVLPDILIDLNQKINYPFNSKIFSNYLFREASNIKGDFFGFLGSTFNLFVIFLKKLSNFPQNRLQVSELEFLVENIDSHTNFCKEIQILNEEFRDFLLNNLDQLLLTIFNTLSAYKDLKLILIYLKASKKVLDLPKAWFKDSIFSDTNQFNDKFSDSVIKFSQNELGLFDKAKKDSLSFFLSIIAESPRLVILANSLEEDELNFWHESFDQTLDNKEITLNLIQNFSNVWSFLNIIKDSASSLQFYLNKIIELFNTEKYSTIVENIFYCNLKMDALDEFNKSLNNQEQVKLNKIKMICQNSCLKIVGRGIFSAELFHAKPKEGYTSVPLNLTELTELRDRALLSKYIIDNRKEISEEDRTHDLQIYDQFVTFVNTTSKYIAILNELGSSLCRDFLQEESDFYLENGSFESLNYYCQWYENYLNDGWKKIFKYISKESYSINFLNGEMIYLIDKLVYDKSKANLKSITKILKYMGKMMPKALEVKSTPPGDIYERLLYIKQFFDGLGNLNENIGFPLKIKSKVQAQDVLILVETKDFYRGILSIYANYQKTLPRADLVQFCHFSTSWAEIKRFLNRSVLNPKKETYTLVYPEKLSLENQIKIDSKLNRFMLQSKFFSLAIVTNDIKSKLVSSLSYNQLIKIEKFQKFMLLSDEQIIDVLENISKNICVVTSAYVGLGKTKFIKQEAKKKKVEYCEISISATYDNSGLSKKIENNIRSSPTLYKLSLNFLSDPEYFHEFIFSLAVFKIVYSEQSIIIIPENSFVYIEVANTFNEKLLNSISFLKFLKNEHIRHFQIERVLETKKLIYVCNYLFKLENKMIDNEDLEFEKNSKVSFFTDKSNYLFLLKKYFLPNCGDFANYHQLKTFLKVLTKLFQHFEQSMFSSQLMKIQKLESRQLNIDIFSGLRTCLMLSILETSKEFMSRCVETVKKGQDSMLKQIEEDKQEELSLDDKSIKWENSNHFIIVFLQDGVFMNIYREPEMVPTHIKKFIISQVLTLKIIKKEIDLKNINLELQKSQNSEEHIEDYKKYKSEQLIEKLLNFYFKFSTKRNLNSKEETESPNTILKRILDVAIKTGYILTPDNFLKMNLIYLRCISRLPLIIMGETGCGKTSLLRFFIENVLREVFLIFYVHSGISISDIEKHLEAANREADLNNQERVWVFFDEFNTSDCMGEIVSILCERKFEGMKLNKNLVFVGACNPYRLKSDLKFKENVGIKKNFEIRSKRQVVHMVKPLPDKAIEFVWDFGVLKHKEIKDYVNSMLDKASITEVKLFTDLICETHKFFQEREDCSSVSLRDVNRFILLYKWFKKSIEERKDFKIEKPLDGYEKCSKDFESSNLAKLIFPEILSFVHCYYLRLASEDDRNLLLEVVRKIFDESKLNLPLEQINNLIKLQELDLLSRMNIPEETALNQALMENIFAIIPCILNKIPIFICGKPGCSKSLAINIISSSLRGDRSSDDYLKTLPELQLVSFQGSDSCTSEGIEEVFKKAEKLLNQNRNILPVVLFDEIGLAEVSSYNPLKVLHRLLEYEICKVGFIAISNWRLDASKMNRALYLARPDPDESDLKKTATTLFCSYRNMTDINQYLRIIDDISKGYYELKQYYAKTKYPDFFGLRDFYHLIKYVARKLAKNQYNNLNLTVQTALYRNFDGLPDSIEKLPKFFGGVFSKEKQNKVSKSLIESNLTEKDTRYLMIICSQDVSEYLKSELLSENIPNFRFILGSTFEKDLSQEDARFRILSDIIGYMEQGVPIVLQNMEIIYSSLYDLFNQNFTVLGKTRKYCRVALGAQFNPRCLVHENFKAVVFLDNQEKTLESTDAPFLNRFEKHYVVLNDIIPENTVNLSKEICKWVETIMNFPNKNENFSQNSVFPVFSEETLSLFILFNNENNDSNGLKGMCKRFLLQNASMDLVLLCRINSLPEEEKDSITEKWKALHSKPLETYIIKLIDKERYLAKNKRVKMISVTYDSTGIEFLKQKIGKLAQLEKCCNFKTEEEFKKNYENFLKSPDILLYVLEIDYSKESQHLRFIICLTDLLDKNFQVTEKGLAKNVCLIVRQKRSDENRKPLFLFKGWRYKMFEDLVCDNKELMEELLQKTLTNIVLEGKIFSFENCFAEIVEMSLETLSLKSNLFNYQYLNSFKDQLTEAIINDQGLIKLFKDKIIESFEMLDKNYKESWVIQLFTNSKVINSAVSIKDALKVFIFNKFLLEFTKLIVICEKKSGLSSLLFAKSKEDLLKIWKNIFFDIKVSQIQVQLNPESNSLNYICSFKTPFFYEEYKILKTKYQELIAKEIPKNLIHSDLNIFHLEKSLWKDKSKSFYMDKIIQENFIRDFIEVSLIEKLCEPRYSDYVYYYVNGILRLVDNGKKFSVLLDSQIKIVGFNNLIIIYTKYSASKIFDWICAKLSSGSTLAISLGEIFERIIEDVSPLGDASSQINCLKTYSEDIGLLNDILLDLIVDSKPKNFDKLEFWVQLCTLNNNELVQEIGIELFRKPHDYLFSTNFTKFLTEIISDQILDSNVSTYRFKVFFYNKVIQNNFEMIPFIVSQVNNPEIYKYLGQLVETIFTITKLKDILENIEMYLEDYRMAMESSGPYLKKLTQVIETLDLTSPFCVLFQDKIKLLKFNIDKNKYGTVCKLFMDFIEQSNITKSKLNLLVAVGRIQFYLYLFAKLINPNNEGISANEQTIVESMKRTLSQRNLLVYELYCLKVLRYATGGNTLKLNIYCRKIKYEWKIRFNEIRVQSILHVFPMVEDIAKSDRYKVIVIKICDLCNNINQLDEIITQPQNEFSTFELGLAFMNTVYLMNTRENFDKSVFTRWYDQKVDMITQKFGQGFSLLLRYFVNNFPEGSICYLHDKIIEKNMNIAMLVAYTVLICISYSKMPNLFSSQFFNINGDLYQDIFQRSQQIYFIGAEPRGIYNYLKMMKENFECLRNKTFNKTFSKGGSYVCSDECDYFYIIQNCGAANQTSKCPYCNKDIGGVAIKIVIREGHRNLSDEEAKDFLDNKCKYYQDIEPKGFCQFLTSPAFFSPRLMIHQATMPILNFFTNSIFYFLHLANIYPADQLYNVYNVKNQDLLKNIEDILSQDYMDLQPKVKEENFVFLFLEAANRFRNTMREFQGQSEVKDHRDQFEKHFEDRLMENTFLELSTSYNQCLNSQTKPSVLISYIEELEVPKEDEYRYTELFRYSLEPNWELMKHYYNLIPNKDGYELLNYIVHNYQELKNLELLWPIVEFSTEMIRECSFEFTRAEAKELTIKELLVKKKSLKYPFKKFQMAWKKLNPILRFDCKTFERLEFNDQTPIGFLLVDTAINSQGIQLAAALKMLCEIQNTICLYLKKNQSESIKYQSLLTLSERDIFKLDQNTLESMIQSCSTNSFQYGKGREIFFDYQQFSTDLEKHLGKAKLLDCENLETVQYQYELLHARSKYAGVINDIREKINQFNLNDEETKNIERKILAISMNLNVEEIEVWNQAYTWLGKVSLCLRHSKLPGEKKIKALQEVRMKGPNQDIRIQEVFNSICLNQFIAVYELVEIKVYPKVIRNIDQQYKKKIGNKIVVLKSLDNFCDKVEKEFSEKMVFECFKVFRRIIIRLLTADVDPEFFIIDYFKIDSYWNCEFLNESERVAELFPCEFKLSNALELDALFEKAVYK